MTKLKYMKSRIILVLMLILTQCRTYDQHISSLPYYVSPESVNSWILIINPQMKTAPNSKLCVLADKKNQLNIFFKHKFSGNLYFSTYNLETGTWQYNNFNNIIGAPSEKLEDWIPIFADNKLLIGSYSTTSTDYQFRIHQQMSDLKWNNILEYAVAPVVVSKSAQIRLTLSKNQRQGTFSYITGNTPSTLESFPFNTDIIGQEALLNIGSAPISSDATKNSYTVVHKDSRSVLSIANSSASELKIFDTQKTGVEYPLEGSYPVEKITFFNNNRDFDLVWLIRQDSSTMFSIHEINLSTKTITEKASGIKGTEAVIKQDSSHEYYIAFINQKGFPQVITTKDFNTFTTLGANDILQDTINNIQLEIINNTPVISFIAQDQIKILIYDRVNSSKDQANAHPTPKAIIENDKTQVTASQPFKVNGSMSTGGVLTYFWKVEPSDGVVISDVTSAIPYITLPERTSPYTISLTVNNNIQSSSETSIQMSAVTTPFPTRIEETFIVDISTIKIGLDWKKLQTSGITDLQIYLVEKDLTTFKSVGTLNIKDNTFKVTRTNNYDPFQDNDINYNYNFKIMDPQKNNIELGTFQYLIPPRLHYDPLKKMALFSSTKYDTEASKKVFNSSAEKIVLNIDVTLEDLKDLTQHPQWADIDTSADAQLYVYKNGVEILKSSINFTTTLCASIDRFPDNYNPKSPQEISGFTIKFIDKNGKTIVSSPFAFRPPADLPSLQTEAPNTAKHYERFIGTTPYGITWTFK